MAFNNMRKFIEVTAINKCIFNKIVSTYINRN